MRYIIYVNYRHITIRVRAIVFNATFNIILAISWRSVILMTETGVAGENHPLATSHLIT